MEYVEVMQYRKKDKKHGMKSIFFCIFLHSDINFRIGRIQKLYNILEEAAGEMIVQCDIERALYYRTFSAKEWIDARQYDVSLDTSKIGLDKSVEFIIKYLE